MAIPNLTGTIVSQHSWTQRLRTLKIAVDGQFDFKAGQFTKIGLPGSNDAKDLMRPYSFVNAPDNPELEFFYDILDPGGCLTPELAQLQPGDKILVSSRPAGLLALDEIPKMANIIFLATGTGLGPFISILSAAEVWEHYERIVLVYGTRQLGDQCYLDLIASCQQKYPNQLKLLRLATREEASSTLKMRIPELITSGLLEEHGEIQLDPLTCQFMLCGNPAMIADTTKLLASKGFPRNRRRTPGNVTVEKYW